MLSPPLSLPYQVLSGGLLAGGAVIGDVTADAEVQVGGWDPENTYLNVLLSSQSLIHQTRCCLVL